MAGEAFPLPSQCIEPTARLMAGRYKALSVPPLAIAAFFLYAFVAYHVRHGLTHGIGPAVFSLAVTVGIPTALGLWPLGKARRAVRAGRLASSDTSLTWHLADSMIVASDSRGVPRPELAFSISRKLRRTLTAVPPATVERA